VYNILLKKPLQKAMVIIYHHWRNKNGRRFFPDLGWRLLTDAMYPAGCQVVPTKNSQGISRRWILDMFIFSKRNISQR